MKAFCVISAMVMIFLGWALLGLGTVISIGYGLYSWAVIDVAFKVALWTAFITWVKITVLAVINLFSGFVMISTIKE